MARTGTSAQVQAQAQAQAIADANGMTLREVAEHNAVAWLALTDSELIERSASLGLPGDLHPDGDAVEGGRSATPAQLAQARRQADAFARDHAGKQFVDAWVKQNR